MWGHLEFKWGSPEKSSNSPLGAKRCGKSVLGSKNVVKCSFGSQKYLSALSGAKTNELKLSS